MIASANSFPVPSAASLHARFLPLLPRIETHARIYFRHIKCCDRKQDCVQEVISLCWKWFVRLAERGKDAAGFVRTLATLAARSVRSGRRVCGQEKAGDVLSPIAQNRYDFAVGTLPEVETLTDNPLMEALHDNTVSPVPDQVCFRVDFAQWLATLTPRNREIAQDMALRYATWELSQKYGISPSRISQLRRAFHDDWTRFCGELLEEESPILAVA
jgi:DNA-directed RNA polymerase specialized sigma24 family protein